MSTLGDVLAGVRRVMILDESVKQLEKRLDILSDDLRKTATYCDSIDRRLVRLETMVEMSRGIQAPRIEG